jgi:hypothetical protein
VSLNRARDPQLVTAGDHGCDEGLRPCSRDCSVSSNNFSDSSTRSCEGIRGREKRFEISRGRRLTVGRPIVLPQGPRPAPAEKRFQRLPTIFASAGVWHSDLQVPSSCYNLVTPPGWELSRRPSAATAAVWNWAHGRGGLVSVRRFGRGWGCHCARFNDGARPALSKRVRLCDERSSIQHGHSSCCVG